METTTTPKTIITENEMREEILEAKRRLCLLLMGLSEDTITDNELDIMLLLSKDEQLQSLFETRTKKQYLIHGTK